MSAGVAGGEDLARAAGELRDWACRHALPFWAGTGFNGRLGCFHERLLADGRPDTGATIRLRVQARQIYVYAHAALLGWFPDGTALALRALEATLEHFHAPDGAPGFVHTVTADGRIDRPLRDTYDHAFMLLALGFLARASGDAQVRALVDGVLAFIDTHLSAGDGTCVEDTSRTLPRRQNPHMHLYEAMLGLHETIAHPQALDRACALKSLLEARFLDRGTGRLTEFFTADWRPAPVGQPFEPGHHSEWSWLIRHHERLAGQSHADPLADRLLDVALGARAPSGLLPDHAAPDGTPVANSARCWPQTELAKALLVRHERDGSASSAVAAAAVLDGIERHYLRVAPRGAWHDRVSLQGEPAIGAMPASTFYHLFVAVAEAARVALPGEIAR